MNKREFLEGIGLAPPESKVTEIIVSEDKVEKITDEPSSATEPSASDKELNELKSKLSELEEKQQQNGENLTERLGSVDTTLAELKGIVKASPLVVQGGELLARLEELEDDMVKAKKAWKAERESLACPNPECGKLVGWPTLEIKQSIKPNYFPVPYFPPFFKPDMESYKECPVCGYKEEVDGQ
ncbi:hypothetical protein ACFLTO_00360 [Chloroflexota bacterium]